MEVEDVCDSLATITQTVGHLLQEAKTLISEGSSHHFVDSQIGRLFRLGATYGAQLQRLGLTTHSQLEDYCQSNFSNLQIQQSLTELDEAESEWEQFLLDIDKQLVKEDEARVSDKQVGDQFSLDASLVDLDTGNEVPIQGLCDGSCKEEFGLSQIVVVSFGAIEGVRRWREDNSCTLRILVDPGRIFYNYLGLYCSVHKSWTMEMMKFYADQIAGGKPLFKPYENIKDDLHQLGGDFIVGEDGHFLLTHRSRISNDRPSISKLLSILSPTNARK